MKPFKSWSWENSRCETGPLKQIGGYALMKLPLGIRSYFSGIAHLWMICRCSCFILYQSSHYLSIWLMSACVPSQNQRSIEKTEESILPCKKRLSRSIFQNPQQGPKTSFQPRNDLAPPGFFHKGPGGTMGMGENSTIEGVQFRFCECRPTVNANRYVTNQLTVALAPLSIVDQWMSTIKQRLMLKELS